MGDDVVTTSKRRGAAALLNLSGAVILTVVPALAQTPLTLEDAIRRAQVETSDARALGAAVDEADARIRRAQSGFWPRVDLIETVQRGNNPEIGRAHV